MSDKLSLGAINKITGEYAYPKIANKKDDHICFECSKDLTLCQGDIRRPYFRHKFDSVNPCHYFDNPTETQIHKDAKMLLKTLLERKIPIEIIRTCRSCKKNEEFENIPEMTEDSVIELEYKFEYNGLKIADVAYIDDGNLLCIFEIYNTHKTCSENRPEPWFEFDAKTLIRIANDNRLSQIQIPCIREEGCEECKKFIENERIKKHTDKKRAIKVLKTWLRGNCQRGISPFNFRDFDGFDPPEQTNSFGFEHPDIVVWDKENERYHINLTQKKYPPQHIQQCDDHGIGLYYVDINWILQQKIIPTIKLLISNPC